MWLLELGWGVVGEREKGENPKSFQREKTGHIQRNVHKNCIILLNTRCQEQWDNALKLLKETDFQPKTPRQILNQVQRQKRDRWARTQVTYLPLIQSYENCKLCASKIEEWTKEGLKSRKQISTQEKGSQSEATAPDLEDCWSGL